MPAFMSRKEKNTFTLFLIDCSFFLVDNKEMLIFVLNEWANTKEKKRKKGCFSQTISQYKMEIRLFTLQKKVEKKCKADKLFLMKWLMILQTRSLRPFHTENIIPQFPSLE